MERKEHHRAWENFLDPEVMQDRLISTSLYIAAFESLKSSIVDRVKQFYQVGFGLGGDTLDPEYAKDVTPRNRSPLYASLDWLIEHDAITDADVTSFNETKEYRNRLAHELLQMISDNELSDLEIRFHGLISLLRKIEVWWVVNVEIPCNPDFDGETEIDEDGIVPGPVWSMQLMRDVAMGKADYLESYREQWSEQAVPPKSDRAGG